MPDKVLVIVPTYNEIENLGNLVPLVLDQDKRIEMLIVDDNSPDGTGQLADQLARGISRIHVLHRERKDGLGRAYLAGFAWALERDFKYIFEMDADFSHDPKFLPEFLRAIEDADLVVGSRYKDGVNVINWPTVAGASFGGPVASVLKTLIWVLFLMVIARMIERQLDTASSLKREAIRSEEEAAARDE